MDRKILTASELGITQAELDALHATKKVLALEQIGFDMNTSCQSKLGSPCGTAACIGGTMSLIMQGRGRLPRMITGEHVAKAHRYVMDESGSLTSLFFGFLGSESPAEGIEAIDNFLAGDEKPWAEIKERYIKRKRAELA